MRFSISFQLRRCQVYLCPLKPFTGMPIATCIDMFILLAQKKAKKVLLKREVEVLEYTNQMIGYSIHVTVAKFIVRHNSCIPLEVMNY